MSFASLTDALREACGVVGIDPPKRRLVPGQWVRTDTKGRNGKDDAAVLIFDDERGGMVWNHQTGVNQRFTINGAGEHRVDPEVERRRKLRDAENHAQQQMVERICADIVRDCDQGKHPYLDRKGFPEQIGLICEDPTRYFPTGRFGEALAKALPGEGPFLVIPGRVGQKITTVQFITPDGAKKNILRGHMTGASYRIATGAQTWVCEGIATALSVRAALRLLGVSATVLSAFSASNVEKVAAAIPGALIAADHDGPNEHLEGKGAGEFYARRSGRKWTQPPALGDFNDMHQADGLRAVALHLREALG